MAHEGTEGVQQYLSDASDRFREVFSGLEEVVKRVFPTAMAGFEYNTPGWKIERMNVKEGERQGTINPRFVYVSLAERKAELTLYLWNPVDYYWLDTQKEELEGAGFKVVRGCVQFKRKRPFPLAAIEDVLQKIAL